MTAITKNNKKVSELSLAEKKELVSAEEAKEKNERLDKFRKELQELCGKYNCTLIAQAIIEGNKVQTRIVPMAL